MLKNIFWTLVLLTMATFTMIFGEGFITPVQTPTPTAIVVDTATPIPTVVTIEPTGIPTNTSVPTVAPTATSTAVPPTATFAPPGTSTTVPPTATVTPTKTATSVPPTATNVPPTATIAATAIVDKFSVQAGTPTFIGNFVHPVEACNWQGVAGQIFDAAGKPLVNYVVKVAGTYNGAPFTKIGIAGMVAGSPYGVGGYEIVLGSSAVASVDLLTIQVFDAQGKPVTNLIPFSTSSTCTQNLVLINFKAK